MLTCLIWRLSQMNHLIACVSEGEWPYGSDAGNDRLEIATWLRGRLASAQLGWLSLGKVTRFVQQAMRDKLLGRRSGRLVPFNASEEFEKQECARAFLPMGVGEHERYVATWADLRSCLAAVILKEEGGFIAICKLKVSF